LSSGIHELLHLLPFWNTVFVFFCFVAWSLEKNYKQVKNFIWVKSVHSFVWNIDHLNESFYHFYIKLRIKNKKLF
jgi:hypothetical protein